MDTNAHTHILMYIHLHIHYSSLSVAFMGIKIMDLISVFTVKSKPSDNTFRDIGAIDANLV